MLCLLLGVSDTDDNNSEELEEDEGLCPICLTEFTDQMVGIPKTCNHIFCLECLQEWAKVLFGNEDYYKVMNVCDENNNYKLINFLRK